MPPLLSANWLRSSMPPLPGYAKRGLTGNNIFRDNDAQNGVIIRSLKLGASRLVYNWRCRAPARR